VMHLFGVAVLASRMNDRALVVLVAMEVLAKECIQLLLLLNTTNLVKPIKVMLFAYGCKMVLCFAFAELCPLRS